MPESLHQRQTVPPKDHWPWFWRSAKYRRQIMQLDPVADHVRIVQLMGGYEFPWDMIRALEVALLRTFTIPRISGLLQRTGEFAKRGQKRYDDTALLVAEFMQEGYDSPLGKKAIAQINLIHGHFPIPNEDYLYVLSTFMFDPVRWVDRFGYRKCLPQEKEALFLFFREVGVRMGLKDIPPTRLAMLAFAENYENTFQKYAPANAKVAMATVGVVEAWVPSLVRPLVFPGLCALLDEAMLKAFHFRKPPFWVGATAKAAMWVRKQFLRHFDPVKQPTYFTDRPNRTYPKGYRIEGLGPFDRHQH